MKETIKLGTRASALAINQTQNAAQVIEKHHDVEVELVYIPTNGDELVENPIEGTLQSGLFTKELDAALLEGKIDFAVHSMKDVPIERPDGIILAGILPRDDPREALVIRKDVWEAMKNRSSDARTMLMNLSADAKIGTSSLRREVQLKRMRRDISVRFIRGNVSARLQKLESGEFDALVLSKAGLNHMGIEGENIFCFDTEDLIPAAGQAIIGIEGSIGNDKLMYLEFPDFEENYFCLAAEREFVSVFNAKQDAPVAAFADISGGQMTLRAFAVHPGTGKAARESISGRSYKARELGYLLAQRVKHKLEEKN